jgi:hypothetical protein
MVNSFAKTSAVRSNRRSKLPEIVISLVFISYFLASEYLPRLGEAKCL